MNVSLDWYAPMKRPLWEFSNENLLVGCLKDPTKIEDGELKEIWEMEEWLESEEITYGGLYLLKVDDWHDLEKLVDGRIPMNFVKVVNRLKALGVRAWKEMA